MDGRVRHFVGDPWLLIDPVLSDAAVRTAATAIFDAANGRPPLPGSIDLDNSMVLGFITRHRLTPAIPAAAIPTPWEDAFQTRLFTIYGVQMRIESVAVRVLEVLAEHNIDCRVLKGLATAELDLSDRTRRQTSDVDLAIRKCGLAAAIAALERAGYQRISGIHRSPYLLKGTALKAPNGIEVDLHARLFQRSPSDVDLFADPGEPLTDLPGYALPRHMRLVHAAGHFALAPPGKRMTSGLLDVTAIRNLGVDLEAARRFAHQLGVEGMVGAALGLEAALSQRTDNALALWAPPDWLDRQIRLKQQRNLALEHIARLRECPAEHRLRYLRHWIVPPAPERALFRSALTRHGKRLRATLVQQ